MKKANFFLFLTLLHAPTHPYPPLYQPLTSIPLSPIPTHLSPSSPFLRNPSRILLAPLPTTSLHPPYHLPATSLLPLYYLSTSSLLPPFRNASRNRYVVHDLSSRPLPTASTSTPPFLRVFSDFSRTNLGGKSEGSRRNLGCNMFLILIISMLCT